MIGSENKIREEEEEEEDEDDMGAEVKKSGEKAIRSNSRSKHSETEHRRRSKINERFQILRDLIPPNDQKRDKASLLLEVIEYVQFLQEKLHMYESSYQQVWAQEPTKLIPWRVNHGPLDDSANHAQIIKNGSMDEHNAAQPLAMRSAVEPDFSADYTYRGADYPAGSSNTASSLNIPFQQFVYPSISNPPTEKFLSDPHGLSSVNERAIIGNEGRTCGSDSNSLSSVYSQGLLKKLTKALQDSGVDLSHSNISVELDVGKQANQTSNIVSSVAEDAGQQSSRNLRSLRTRDISGNDFGVAFKKLRTEES